MLIKIKTKMISIIQIDIIHNFLMYAYKSITFFPIL